MEGNEFLVTGMFLFFIALLFTGFPVAWVLGGIGILFAGVGYLSDIYLGTFTGLDYLTLGLVVNRIWKIMENNGQLDIGRTSNVHFYGCNAR